MAGIIKSKLEGRTPEELKTLNELVAIVMGDPIVTAVTPKLDAENAETGEFDTRVNTVMLEALIELLTGEKKKAKAVDEAMSESDKAIEKAEAEAVGATLVKDVEVDDEVTFVMGSGKNKKEFTRKVLKKGDKTVTVEFTDDYLCTTSPNQTGKKFIKFAAIKSIKKAVKAAKPEAVKAATPEAVKSAAVA